VGHAHSKEDRENECQQAQVNLRAETRKSWNKEIMKVWF